MSIWIFFFLFGWSSFALEEGEVVYLWKGKNSLIDQTVSIPQPLIIINYTQPEPSTPFQNINRFLKPPHLDGKVCAAIKDQLFSQKIEGILPPNTPLKITKAFTIINNPGFIRNLVVKLMDFNGIGVKGGPLTYYIAMDSENKEFIINEITASNINFYIYNWSPSKKAARIISDFTKRGEQTQRVSLTFELSKEHDEKCGYGWPKGQEPKRMKPEEEMQILIEKTLKTIEESSSLYVFKNINSNSNQIAVDVNDKSLAFLILNSSPLRIKNISLIE